MRNILSPFLISSLLLIGSKALNAQEKEKKYEVIK